MSPWGDELDLHTPHCHSDRRITVVKTAQEPMAWARSEKGGLIYASAGLGGPQHVAGEQSGKLRALAIGSADRQHA